MEYIKTVKYYVSGSNKDFEIYKCVVDEVEEVRDSKDRKAIRVKIGEKEYQGLHNKSVYDFLCQNEGEESFVVLWPSGKGNHMLAYKWDIWSDHLNGSPAEEPQAEEPEPSESKEAFVYMWVDELTDRKYIGMHKGEPDDGYLGSGSLFLEVYNQRPEDFTRTILAYGTQEQMLHLETILILQLKARTSGMYYNVSDNLRK